jgi:pyruvate dehydrogenase E2 component (dihydrolipoamide acetyltransferase)
MTTQILMPALSPTMEEGRIAKWHVKEGDAVKTGDVLAEIETDKATMEFEAIDDGRIGKILVPEGAEHVKVNQPIAVLLGEGEKADAASQASAAPAAAPSIPDAMKAIRDAIAPAQQTQNEVPPLKGEGRGSEAAAGRGPAQTPTRTAPPSGLPLGEGGTARGNGAAHPSTENRIFASPLARRIAKVQGIDLSALHGSGPRGRIVRADVEGAKKGIPSPIAGEGAPQARKGGEPQPSTRPAAQPETTISGIAPLPDARLFFKEDEYELVPHDNMRKTIARRLTSAKALIPHYYLTVDCDIANLMAARARLNAAAPKGEAGYRLSVNDVVIKAAAMALMKHPDVNASWTETALLRHKHADIGVAVDLNPGLITPIVFQAEQKGLAEISNDVRSLAERAKAKKLKPQEYEGGCFSISNLGMFGIKDFTALINPPQSAILAVGMGEERAVVRDGKIVAATMMSVTMSCDHRIIDGATGARFLQTFKSFIEEPAAMLL